MSLKIYFKKFQYSRLITLTAYAMFDLVHIIKNVNNLLLLLMKTVLETSPSPKVHFKDIYLYVETSQDLVEVVVLWQPNFLNISLS